MSTNQTTKWYDEFTIALRLREVRGTAIGDAIAEVESHCAESGEKPEQAFGDARRYAASLDFPAAEMIQTSTTDWTRLIAPIGAGLVAVNLIGPLVTAFDQHSSMAITWGWLAALAVMALGIVLTMRILSALINNWINFALFFGGFLALTVGIGMLWKTVAFTLSPWLGVGIVVVLLVASVIGMHLSQRQLDDPLVDPRKPVGGQKRGLLVMTEWLFVIVALGMLLIDLIPIWFR